MTGTFYQLQIQMDTITLGLDIGLFCSKLKLDEIYFNLDNGERTKIPKTIVFVRIWKMEMVLVVGWI